MIQISLMMKAIRNQWEMLKLLLTSKISNYNNLKKTSLGQIQIPRVLILKFQMKSRCLISNYGAQNLSKQAFHLSLKTKHLQFLKEIIFRRNVSPLFQTSNQSVVTDRVETTLLKQEIK